MIRFDSLRRTRLRSAIGSGNLDEIVAAAQLMDYEAPWQIPLHESGIFEDLRHEWLRTPVIDLYDAIDEVEHLDLADDTVVGRTLRSTFTTLVRASERVGSLEGFFARFRSRPYLDVLIEMIEDGLQAAWLLSEALTADRDEVAWAAADA